MTTKVREAPDTGLKAEDADFQVSVRLKAQFSKTAVSKVPCAFC
jgi:hypothetical protein